IPFMIAPPTDKEMKAYPLAAMVEGKFKSAFDGVRPASIDLKKRPAVEGAIAEAGLKESVKRGVAVVIGSSEITSGQLVDPDGKFPNGAFIMNIVDYMNGRTDTPEMRSKGLAFNPLDNTTELTRFLIKGINIFIVPILSIIAGLIVWRRRSVRRKAIQVKFAKEGSRE
ncbi:MAG TPA: ABC transporter, partial [Spirochaetota bacterium]